MHGIPARRFTVAVTFSVTVSVPVRAAAAITFAVVAAVLLPISFAAAMRLSVPITAAMPLAVTHHGWSAAAARSSYCLLCHPQVLVLPLTLGGVPCCFALCCASKTRFRRLNFVSLSCSVSKCVTCICSRDCICYLLLGMGLESSTACEWHIACAQ